MKKWFFLLLTGVVLFLGACKKSKTAGCTATESTLVATAAEIDSLSSYINHNSIIAAQDASGVFYTIDSLGTGLAPGICSAVAVTYSGYLLGNPVPFQTYLDTAGVTLTVTDLIIGWQKVMPRLKVGGGMTIYIPPSLGYGSADKRNPDGDIIVPHDSYLKFNIHLIGVY
jgi:FKBP-type peptidyl-prolyl cis-trans isomerase FkpA